MKLVSRARETRFLNEVNMGRGSASDSGEGAILPTWTSVDVGNVKTMKELMEGMKKDGWNVDVSTRHRFNALRSLHPFVVLSVI